MNKFRAIALDIEGRSRQVCDFMNIEFKKAWDSSGEYTRYIELTRLQDAGDISGLRTQVTYELHVRGNDKPVAKYVADYVYEQDGKTVVEDFKGFKTRIYLRSKKHLQLEYGIKIFESNAPIKKRRTRKKS